MTAETLVRTVPVLGPNRPLKLPKTVERTLDNGLTVIALRRSSVPLVEIRLRVPFAKAHLARAALLKRMYGKHPYSIQTPAPEQVEAVTPGTLRTLHAERLHPAGATLVIVGDIAPEKAIVAAERMLSKWDGAGVWMAYGCLPYIRLSSATRARWLGWLCATRIRSTRRARSVLTSSAG